MTVPPGWEVLDVRGFGPFVTEERYRLPDGSERVWRSRAHRKTGELQERAEPTRHGRWFSVTWAPERLTWWIGVLFMIGSACFVLGSFPPYADRVAARTDAITYFVGSLFFTSAGYLQYLETINTPDDLVATTRQRFSFFAWQPRKIDWWSTAVQFVGTLLFNLSTVAVLIASLSATQQQRLSWVPDLLGSVCFMIASVVAWIEVCGGWWKWSPGDVSWRIVALNLAGSIAFQLSALGAYLQPGASEPANLRIDLAGTFIGAVCFFIGAYLLLPELSHLRTDVPASQAPHK